MLESGRDDGEIRLLVEFKVDELLRLLEDLVLILVVVLEVEKPVPVLKIVEFDAIHGRLDVKFLHEVTSRLPDCTEARLTK